MKILYILWTRIKSQLKEHFIIVFLFFIGIFFSTLFYIYYYGDYVKPSAVITGLESLVSKYTIHFSHDTLTADDDRLSYLEEYGSVTVFSTSQLSATETCDILKSPECGEYTVQARKGNDFGYGSSYGSIDLNQKDDCIVFPWGDSNLDIKKLKTSENPEIVFSGVTLSVIGVHDMGLSACVPYELFENGTLHIDQIDIQLPKYLSKNDSADFVFSLQTLFPKAEVVDPYVYYQDSFSAEDAARPIEMVKAMGLMLLAVFTFMFLAKHLFDMSQSENIVYRAIGGEREAIVLLSLGEMMIFAVLSIVLAVVTHILLYPSFFEKMRLNVNQPYTANDYILISVSALLICVVACIPFLIVFWRKTVIELKRNVE